MLSVIPNRKKFLAVSAALVALSWLAVAGWGLRLGIDFTGGSLWEVEFLKERPSNAQIIQTLAFYKIEDALFQPTNEREVIIKFRPISESTHEAMKRDLNDFSPLQEKRFESIGPSIGSELKRKSLKAIIYVLVLIVVYIAWAFRKVARPVSSWKYGLAAIVALAHDVSIPIGVFAVLGRFSAVEVDSFFVTALLTVLGFSVHDTIVVFDRVRENLKKGSGGDFAKVVDESVNKTLARSINTSLTVILVLLSIYFFGGDTTKYFALALMVGVFFGTYSSIFVAGPLLSYWAGGRSR